MTGSPIQSVSGRVHGSAVGSARRATVEWVVAVRNTGASPAMAASTASRIASSRGSGSASTITASPRSPARSKARANGAVCWASVRSASVTGCSSAAHTASGGVG